MVARLGFSIAAHLEPDILLIDEVLAVGDLAFQQRAFARIEELVRRGVPAVVVSHQLNQVMQLCDQAVLLSHGTVVCAGTAAECVARYVSEGTPPSEDADAPIRLSGIAGPFPSQVAPGDRVRLHVQGTVLRAADGARPTVGVRVRMLPREELLFVAHSAGCGVQLPDAGPFELEIELEMNVGPGSYRAQAAAWDLRDLREIARGPSTLIGVGAHASASGTVFASPRMRVLRP